MEILNLQHQYFQQILDTDKSRKEFSIYKLFKFFLQSPILKQASLEQVSFCYFLSGVFMNTYTQEVSAATHVDYLDTRVDQAVQSFWENVDILVNAEELEHRLSEPHCHHFDMKQLN